MLHSFFFKYLNTSLVFQSSIPDIIDYIAFIFGNLRANSSRRADRIYEIQKEDCGYSLIHNGKILFNNFPLNTTIENIEISVELMTIAENRGIVFFHAGAVSDMDGSISLLFAGSGGGKTTLCSMLSQSGFHFEGDELLGISQEKPLIPLAFKRAPKLRRETIPFLKDSGRLLNIAGEEGSEKMLTYWLPDEKEDAMPGGRKTIRRLFLLRFSPQQPNTFSLLSPSEAIKCMIDECHDFSARKKMAICVILDIISKTETFQIEYNHPEFAFFCIQEGWISFLNKVRA